MSEDADGEAKRARASSARLISASAIMMAGTLVSRLVGFGRLLLLAYLFGVGTRQADMFAVANAVPTSMYILLVGGVLNTVLVPQIVRATKSDADGGEAYTNRIMTGGLIVLFVITLALTLAVPAIISLYSAAGWKDPDIAAQYASMVALGYYCMPQVFFYGVYVLAGQILNARDRFGPMMWSPIANNVIFIAVLLIFLGVFGQTNTGAAFSPGQELLLGLGSTLGIAAQALLLAPFLRSVGYRFAPRFDFRGTGLGHTVRLAKWTLGFVLITQAGLVVINKVATAATVDGEGGGLAAYSYAYAVFIVPHSLITVSLATAMLPSASRLAHAGDLPGVAEEVGRTWRLALTALLPAALAFLLLGVPIARLVFGFGAGSDDADFTGWALMTLSLGLVPFTLQYICLRAFYALENTRTPFFLQALITGCYVTLGVTVATLVDSNPLVAACLGIGLAMAYLIGVVASTHVLKRSLPELRLRPLVALGGRLLLAFSPGMAAAGALVWGVESTDPGQLQRALALAGAVLIAVAGYLGLSRLLHVAEVADIVRTVTRRGGSGNSDNAGDPGDTGADPGAPGDSTESREVASPSIDSAGTKPIDENADHMGSNALTSEDVDTARPRDALTPEPPDGLDQAPTSPSYSPSYSMVSAGTVLADRYRLEELLAEAPPTVTWRAFDLVLSRSVLLHLLPPHDPNADELLDLARQAAVATDSRFLRVLDAVHSDADDIGSYIVCEYAAGQSLEVLLSHGPLSGLESAWVVREVADALSGVHSLGLHHSRINPDTVVLTPDGHVKIVGLLIEQALRPPPGSARLGHDPADEPPRPEDIDVADLGRLLYACLVSRWPGGPAFSLPAAPATGRHWLSPRQVRAGVSPALDNICDQILGDPPRRRAPRLGSANEVVNALTGVLGPADASGDLERRLRQPIPRVTTTPPPAPLRSGLGRSGSARSTMRASLAPTAAAPPPPPAGPSHPVSPTITADDVTRVTVIRQPPPPAPVRTASNPAPRRWIAVVALMALLLIATGIASAVVLRQRGTSPPATAQSGSPLDRSSPTSIEPPPADRIASARDFDPQGDPPNSENSDEVRYAIDGKAQTRWRTVNYLNNPKLGGIKRGVGLVLDLGDTRVLSTVRVQLSGNGTDLEARVPRTDPADPTKPPMSTDASWRTVSTRSQAGESATLTLGQPANTRFVLVYLTSLPKEGSGYRGGIYEVQVS